MEQGSPEWLEWRKKGIGASESAKVLEIDPYHTRLELWKIKTGREEADDISYKMERVGKDTEDLLRSKHSLFKQRNFQPRLAFNDEFPFMLASLDGYDEDHAEIVEMKFLGKEKYEAAGTDPNNIDFMSEHHRIQCQHQMFVLGVPQMEYLISCDAGATYKYFVIKADSKMQNKILAACVKFWNWVKTDKQPPFGKDDYRPIKDKVCLKLIESFKAAKEKGDKKEIEFCKTELRAKLKHPKMEALGVKISPSGFRLDKAVKTDNPAIQPSQDMGKAASPTA